MYNSYLHNEWVNKLKEACRDKNVLIVGNSIKLCGKEYGELIDSYDFVVRLGKGVPYQALSQFVGTKTDCWMTGFMRIDDFASFGGVKFKILMYIPLSKNNKLLSVNVSRVFFSERLQLYKDYFTIGALEDVADITEYPIGVPGRPSQGYAAAKFFLSRVGTYKSLSIIGFDFFESKITYKYDNSINEVSSFHIPIPIFKGKDSNPHVHSERQNYEKGFFLEQEVKGNLSIHKVDTNPSEGTMKILMSLFRQDGEVIQLT